MQENLSFKENLEVLLQEFRKNSQIAAEIEDNIEGLLDLNYNNTLTLFRIAQESLSNTARHSKAQNVELKLWEEDSQIYLEIIDNGEGFNVDKTEANLGHGLANMQRRTRKAGGGIQIDSSPGNGTKVIAWVPKE